MSQNPSRRSLIRGLLASLLGWAGIRSAARAASPSPPRCRHYHDGLLWAAGRPGVNGYYVRDPAGCPLCLAEQLAAKLPRSPAAGPQVTTCVYDAHGVPLADPFPVTTYTYDALGRASGRDNLPGPQSLA